MAPARQSKAAIRESEVGPRNKVCMVTPKNIFSNGHAPKILGDSGA
jgi:hypothetical protein